MKDSSGDKYNVLYWQRHVRVTDAAFLRENTKVKGLFEGCQRCFPFPFSHLQMPLKEVSGWFVPFFLPIRFLIPKVNTPNVGLPISALFHLCGKWEWRRCHHQLAPNVSPYSRSGRSHRHFSFDWSGWAGDAKPGIIYLLIFGRWFKGGAGHASAVQFLQLTFFKHGLGWNLTFFMRWGKKQMVHVCQMSVEGRVQTCRALSC